MILDPDNKKININVSEWICYLENEYTLNDNFRGYTTARFKGNVYKFDCKGTIYGNNKDSDIRYLESVAFDDVIKMRLNIATDKCNFVSNTIDPVNNEITGYIIVTSFNPSDVFAYACDYTLSGYYFPSNTYNQININSYFNLGPVSASTTDGSIAGSNSTMSVLLNKGIWSGIQITGGVSFSLKPLDYIGYHVFAEEIDNGQNVAKWQINTCIIEDDLSIGPIIDISYMILNRGGFKLQTNIAWEITCSGFTKSIFKSTTGYKDYRIQLPENSIIGSNSALLLGSVPANISNYDSFYWDADSLGYPTLFTTKLKTQRITGNIISIGLSNESVIPGITSGGNLSTGLNVSITGPMPGQNVNVVTEGADKVCYVPVEFTINDGSRVTGIDIKLKLGYSANTWDFVDSADIDTITSFDPLDYKYGGFINAKFIIPSSPGYYKHAGIELIVYYDGSNHEHGISKYTFSIGMDPGMTLAKIGGNGAVKAVVDLKNQMQDYPIFQMSDLDYGIYDLYFYFNVNYGKCVVDLGLYSNDLTEAYLESDIIDEWRDLLDGLFVVSNPSVPTNVSAVGNYNAIDYNGGGMHYIMKDLSQTDPGVPSTAIFKRTVLIKQTTDTHVHARVINYGSSPVTGFTVVAVPLFSHDANKHFIGDCITALTPNVKNKILIPIN